jgi:hypothetical protein
MVVFFTATIITCSDAIGILNRLQNVVALTQQQKIEISKIVRHHVPTCPIKVQEDGKSNRN